MYRTIETTMWQDPAFKALNAQAKYLYLYLNTNRHSHCAGIYYLPLHYAAHETSLPDRDVQSAVEALSRAQAGVNDGGVNVNAHPLVRYDAPSEVVWVVNMFREQGRGEKIVKAAANHVRTLHNCPLVKEFLMYYPEVKAVFASPKRASADTSSDGASHAASKVNHSGTGAGPESAITPRPPLRGVLGAGCETGQQHVAPHQPHTTPTGTQPKAADEPPPGEPQGFTAFWNLWPNDSTKVRQQRSNTLRRWETMGLEGEATTILRCLAALLNAPWWQQQQAGRSACSPSEFLEKRVWQFAQAPPPQGGGIVP